MLRTVLPLLGQEQSAEDGRAKNFRMAREKRGKTKRTIVCAVTGERRQLALLYY